MLVTRYGTGNTPSRIASADSPVTVIGTNGSGIYNYGVSITDGGLITSTGNGSDISITGIGGGNSNPIGYNYGVNLNGNPNTGNNTITANGDDIVVNAIEGSGSDSYGIYGGTTTAINIGDATTPGNVTLITNNAAFSTTSGSAINASNLLIVPRTDGVGIGLGCTTDAKGGPLNLSNAELGTFNTGSIQLDNSSTGNFTVASGVVSIPSGSNLTLFSNSTASTGISSSGTISMGTGKLLNLSVLPSLNTQINGPTALTQYNQLNVLGDLSLTGKALKLSGNYTSTGGNVFVVANATNLTGTFTGLADGATTTLKDRTLIVKYNSTSATLTDPTPYVISQPANSTLTVGSTATFTATAGGTPSPTVQWQVNSGSGWSDIGGEISATYSFTTTTGDNGNQYRAVFTNTYGNSTTNAATLTIGIAPIITTASEMTIPLWLNSGMTVIATGNPTSTYSIISGSLPTGVTLDSSTGLFLGIPAAGTVGNWPVTIEATNGFGTADTQVFCLKVTSTITSFTVSKGDPEILYPLSEYGHGQWCISPTPQGQPKSYPIDKSHPQR